MPIKPADKLRAICLALPGATETAMKRGPTYRIGNKIFAWDRLWGDSATVWLKVPEGVQGVLVGADPQRFFVPPYVGQKGWVGMRLDGRPDWKEVEALVRRSYRLVAPRRLGAACD
jgi:predicted DNA-binding protein (MmcQ/YjbR family)